MKTLKGFIFGCALAFSGSVIVTGLVLSLSATPANADLFAALATGNWAQAKEVYNFKVEAYGSDLRVYQYTSEANPNLVCTTVFANAGPAGTSCVNVTE